MGGVPLWVRIDNLKTAVARGAGPSAVLTPAFAAFAQQCGFAVDPCRARTGSDKGKVERTVRTDRGAFADLFLAEWPSLAALQAALDARATELHARRRCPATGTTIAEALAAEQRVLQPVPAMHGVIVLDVTDPTKPREVSRASVGDDESPHWIAIDHSQRRVVLNSGGRGNRLFILNFDPATGAISVDQRFRDPGSARAGIALTGVNWPGGFVGNVVPHGAVFSR